MTYTIAKKKTGEKVAGHDNVSVLVSDVIYDALQTPANNPLWTVDNVGFNFALEISAATNSPFPQADEDYVITTVLTLATGNKAAFNVEVHSQRNYAS